MKWIVTLFLTIAFCGNGYAQKQKKSDLFQQFQQTRMRDLANVNGGSNGGVFTFSEVNRQEGHRFLFNDWTKGRVLFSGYEYFSEEIDMVIDGEFERLYILFEDETEGLLPLAQIRTVQVFPKPGDTVEFVVQDLGKISSEADEGLRFYQRVFRGNHFVVLHHERKYLRKEEYIENVGLVRRPDEYKSLHSYYLLHDGQLHKIRKSRSKIESALPKYKKTIRQVEKDTKNKLKTDQELHQFFVDLEARIDQR